MKVRDAIRLIEQDGWKLKPTREDHQVYIHATKPGIVVIPGHLGSDVATGTLSRF